MIFDEKDRSSPIRIEPSERSQSPDFLNYDFTNESKLTKRPSFIKRMKTKAANMMKRSAGSGNRKSGERRQESAKPEIPEPESTTEVVKRELSRQDRLDRSMRMYEERRSKSRAKSKSKTQVQWLP